MTPTMDSKPYHSFLCVLFLLTFTSLGIFAQAPELGFVQSETVKVSGKLTDASLYPMSTTQKQVVRQYLDGLGRPVQTVYIGVTPSSNDLIQPVAYDNLGRKSTSYLPYAGSSTDISGSFRSSALSDQDAFYLNGNTDKVADDNSPFSQIKYEDSPLQRVVARGMVGEGFQPVSGQHFKTISYRYNNTATDGNIIIWGPDATNQGNYAANTLAVTVGTEEDGRVTTIFTDAIGHMILKRQLANTVINGATVTNFDTYYIYNMAGLLSYVIPPKATAMINTGALLTDVAVSNLLFKNTYDDHGRVWDQTVPGGGVTSYVYDPLGRLALMQNPKLRLTNKWTYYKYDVKGRIIGTGYFTMTHSATYMRSTIVPGWDYSTWYESPSTNFNNGYYTVNSPPSASLALVPMSYKYYDDYDIDGVAGNEYSYLAQGLSNEGTADYAVRGMPTVTRDKTVGAGLDGTSTWITRAVFYDKNGRTIQVRSNNVLSGSVSDTRTYVYAFNGTKLYQKDAKVVASGSSENIQVVSSYSYDHVNRLKSISQSYGGATIKIAGYTYNEIGQLIDRKLGSPDLGTTWLQSIDYTYNIRGQMRTLNNSTLTNDSGTGGNNTNDESNDLFGMSILYDKTDAKILNTTTSFNGNISAVKWMSVIDATGTKSAERSYRYNYDKLNRLTAAGYQERWAGETGNFTHTNGFGESGITYDENGNIKTLIRNSGTQGSDTHVTIDNLTYTYDSNEGNKLTHVSDAVTTTYSSGFNPNGSTSTDDYVYESGTGNLTTDPYKGLTIAYNVMNLTDKITVAGSTTRYLDYTYDASGTLLRKRVIDNNVIVSKIDYIDGFVYVNGVLSYFATPEGRVRKINSTTLRSEYNIMDHQGNVRVTFDGTGSGGTAKVVQESSYYGFGMVMTPTVSTTTDQTKLYNGGSDWQNDYNNLPDLYQTFYRNYDAALGRFIASDPKSALSESVSVYQYANNNPAMSNDPMGDLAQSFIDKLEPGVKYTNNDDGTFSGDDGTTIDDGMDYYITIDGQVDHSSVNESGVSHFYLYSPGAKNKLGENATVYEIPSQEALRLISNYNTRLGLHIDGDPLIDFARDYYEKLTKASDFLEIARGLGGSPAVNRNLEFVGEFARILTGGPKVVAGASLYFNIKDKADNKIDQDEYYFKQAGVLISYFGSTQAGAEVGGSYGAAIGFGLDVLWGSVGNYAKYMKNYADQLNYEMNQKYTSDDPFDYNGNW